MAPNSNYPALTGHLPAACVFDISSKVFCVLYEVYKIVLEICVSYTSMF